MIESLLPYIVALACLVGTAINTVRSVDSWADSRWLQRGINWTGVAAWVGFLAAFYDVGQASDDFIWRQWLVGGALTALVILQLVQIWFARRTFTRVSE